MSKLYVEYRLYVNPHANQDTLRELAEHFQEHIYDIWNNDAEHGASLDVTDITYEIVRDIEEPVDTRGENPFDTWEEKRGEK